MVFLYKGSIVRNVRGPISRRPHPAAYSNSPNGRSRWCSGLGHSCWSSPGLRRCRRKFGAWWKARRSTPPWRRGGSRRALEACEAPERAPQEPKVRRANQSQRWAVKTNTYGGRLRHPRDTNTYKQKIYERSRIKKDRRQHSGEKKKCASSYHVVIMRDAPLHVLRSRNELRVGAVEILIASARRPKSHHLR